MQNGGSEKANHSRQMPRLRIRECVAVGAEVYWQPSRDVLSNP
jgi:hypothetical protein